jgi:hypothetical protein
MSQMKEMLAYNQFQTMKEDWRRDTERRERREAEETAITASLQLSTAIRVSRSPPQDSSPI